MVVSVRGAPRAALIFLHGSGDTGAGLQEYLRFAWHGFLPALAAAGVDCHFPSASPRPYRLAGGQTSSVWFDRYALEPTAREHTESIDESCTRLETLIDKIVASGVPEERHTCHISLTPHISIIYFPHLTRHISQISHRIASPDRLEPTYSHTHLRIASLLAASQWAEDSPCSVHFARHGGSAQSSPSRRI